MKIFFTQDNAHEEPGWYTPEVLPEFPTLSGGGVLIFVSYPDSYCNRIPFIVHQSTRDKLNVMISELFESVTIDDRTCSITDIPSYTAYYKFEDKADEAAFLL